MSDRFPRWRLQPSEWAAAIYALLLIGICVGFRGRIPGWPLFAAGHALLLAGIVLLTRIGEGRARILRDFSMAAIIPAFFLLAGPLIHQVHPVDRDDALIAVDRAIGGLALLRAMSALETPGLTTLSHAFWMSYYVLPFFPALALYRNSKAAFEEAKLIFVLGWLASYAGYFLVPAEGPGYRQEEIGIPQPSWPHPSMKLNEAIHTLEGEARDTFPSGHATVAALTILLCLRHRLGLIAAIAVPLSAGILWSTLYLRYHYLSDVVAGCLLAALCFWIGISWSRRAGKESVTGPTGGP